MLNFNMTLCTEQTVSVSQNSVLVNQGAIQRFCGEDHLYGDAHASAKSPPRQKKSLGEILGGLKKISPPTFSLCFHLLLILSPYPTILFFSPYSV
jgi:hypothetical protein